MTNKTTDKSKNTTNYDFNTLTKALPELKSFTRDNGYGIVSIDFFNPEAVKALNKAILISEYGIEYWELPKGALVPPIPSRASYLEAVKELLDGKSEGVKVLDIGVGANCIYPIIGAVKYGWSFVGSDTSRLSVENAQRIVTRNAALRDKVEIRLQQFPSYIYKGVILSGEQFDIAICNPPFHSSSEEASKAAERKLRNLRGGAKAKATLNFGGVDNELWCDGGEKSFISRMIKESKGYSSRCKWFTTLVSKESNLPHLYKQLERLEAAEYGIIELEKGNKNSRILAWRY